MRRACDSASATGFLPQFLFGSLLLRCDRLAPPRRNASHLAPVWQPGHWRCGQSPARNAARDATEPPFAI